METRWLLDHRSPWTGLKCRTLEITGKPCNGKSHVSVGSRYSHQGLEAPNQEG